MAASMGWRPIACSPRRSLGRWRRAAIAAVEVGAGQAAAVAAIMAGAGLALRAVRHDLSGVDRCLVLGLD